MALHFTAFHPDFKLKDRGRTPAATLDRAREIAREVGLHYVYEGNIFTETANTSCPSCGAVLIRRSWHDVVENRIVAGKCCECGTEIAGRWWRGGTPPKLKSDERLRRYGHLNL
ncbi:MAG: hypothetical protein JO119_22050 [Acidobacteria bacterium]|nr:hypothetical protein [Acidobacteriota bacterium]